LVRKQYHFRPGAHGLDAWAVDRLIELTAGMAVEAVVLLSIEEIDTPYWFGPTGQVPTVRALVDHMRLVEEVDSSHPIILGADGRVMDGMHRIARALLAGEATIDAVRFEMDPEPDHTDCRPEDLPY
jgi:hypothetical protein